MTLARTLSLGTLEKIQGRFALREVGAPYLTLSNPAFPQPLGACRLFTGERVRKMVYIGLTFPPAGLDSHMIFAFTPPDSLTPHFTLDSVLAGPHFAFHLDLIPRVDLGANLAYLNAVFQPAVCRKLCNSACRRGSESRAYEITHKSANRLQPLTAELDAAKKIEGLTPAQLSPRQYALMSPWMLAYRATESAFAQIDGAVNAYLEHWFGVVENGVSAPVSDGLSPAERDRLNRAAIFNPEVDPVWAQIDRMLGAEVSAKLREILRNQEVEG